MEDFDQAVLKRRYKEFLGQHPEVKLEWSCDDAVPVELPHRDALARAAVADLRAHPEKPYGMSMSGDCVIVAVHYDFTAHGGGKGIMVYDLKPFRSAIL